MSIWTTLSSWARRTFTWASADQRGPSRGSSGESVDASDVLGLSAGLACVRLIAGTIGTLPLGVYREAGGHKVPVPDHPLWRMLHRAPNSEQTVVDFWEGGSASLELRGNLVARKIRGVGDRVIALEPMPWDMTQVRRNDVGALVYEYDQEKYSADEILHVRGFGGSPEGGLSTVAMACETFGLAKATHRAASGFFRNGVSTSGLLKYEKKLNPEQRNELEDALQRRYAGAQRTGLPMVLDGDMSWAPTSFNAEEAQLIESRRMSVEDVCRIFGVPPHMVGHSEKSTSWGTGLEQQTLGFNKYTLRPRLKRIETALEQQLFTPEDIAKGYSIEFNLEGLLRADSKGRAEVQQIYLQNNVYTINEVRAFEGKGPVPWGDEPWVQQQDVQIGSDGSVPPKE